MGQRMDKGMTARPSWFQRFLLPGFAFKAVVIGGGYATGRELVEFFMPAGPWGGVAAILLATLLWSGLAALTFAFARQVGALDYRSFFTNLLGRGWRLFEAAYLLLVVLLLSVFSATAGELGAALFGWPRLAGTLLLAGSMAGFAAFGNAAVEALFKYVSFLLYFVYALFLVLILAGFGDRIAAGFGAPAPETAASWLTGGITYAAYNVAGAVMILPVLRHLTSRRDAVLAGLAAGPLAMAPALLFFVGMVGFYPGIMKETLPSDAMLRALDLPAFHFLFQFMIFAALLESGTGAIHAINERVARAWQARRGTELGSAARGLIALALLGGCIFVADRFGLVALIANGYRFLALLFLAVFVAPLVTIGLVRLIRQR